MKDRIQRTTLFALYQTSIALGIVLMPAALALDRLGLKLPIHRLVDSLGQSVDQVGANSTR